MSDTRKLYTPSVELSIPAIANPRYGDVSITEATRAERDGNRHGYCRCIGGDVGDILHNGYFIDGNRTVLLDPVLRTTEPDLTPDEVDGIMAEVLQFAFMSVGTDCVL